MARSFNRQISWTIIAFLVASLLWTTGAAVRAFFLMPDIYVGTARIDLNTAPDSDSVHKEMELIASRQVLTNVIVKLRLKEKWAHRYFNDETLKLGEVLEIFDKRLLLSPKRNTSIVSISFYGDNPDEVAEVANGIAETYLNFKLETLKSAGSQKMTWSPPKILEPARTPLQPVRSDKVISAVTGLLISVPVGFVAAGLTALWFVIGKTMFASSKGSVARRNSYQPEIKQRY